MLVWLLITTALSTSFTTNFPAECGGYATLCDADAYCTAFDAGVWMALDQDLTGIADFAAFKGIMAAMPGMPTTDFAMAYMLVATGAMNYGSLQAGGPLAVSAYPLLSNMYQCDCALTETCDWNAASGFVAAIGTCAMDADCAKDWNTVTKETGDKWDVKYQDDTAMLGIKFPVTGQDDKQYCKIGAGVQMMNNAKLMYLFYAVAALTMPEADKTLETCGKLFMGGVIGMVAGVAIGVMILTIIAAVAYCYCCQNKDN